MRQYRKPPPRWHNLARVAYLDLADRRYIVWARISLKDEEYKVAEFEKQEDAEFVRNRLRVNSAERFEFVSAAIEGKL